MYKVFPVVGGHQIFWCPHYQDLEARTKAEMLVDARPYSKKIYSSKQAAHRRCKQLNDTLKMAIIYHIRKGIDNVGI